MSDSLRCGQCGSPLLPNWPQGLCSRCALEGALALSVTANVSGLSESSSARSMPEPAGSPDSAGDESTFGDYELLEEIARGGMGVVYKARQKRLGRLVAVKFLLRGEHADAASVKRFRIEAASAASLQHPHIVAIHEVGEHDGRHFFAMDLVEGPNLARVLRDGPLAPSRAAGYVKAVAEAIHYAHTRQILHRDLKPSNVLIDANDQPRVTDFGLAKNMAHDSELTKSGQIFGSPSFMPPEQAAGQREKVDVRSDVYSLGAILYHALTGRPPFVGATMTETLKLVETTEPVAPGLLSPHLPRDLETICLKCLRKEQGKRYASAQALADELGRFLRQEPILARPSSRAEKIWRWGRRNPLAAAFVGTICVGLVSSLWLLVQVSRAKDEQFKAAESARQSEGEMKLWLRNASAMAEENLETIWGNREKRTLDVVSENIAALAQNPIVHVTNKSRAVRWTMGVTVDEHPVDRLRRYAAMLSELEAGTSLHLGREVRIDVRIFKFHQDFIDDLASGRISFGRSGALQFLRARRSTPGLIPMVVPLTPFKKGLLFTRTHSPIRSVRDIRGHCIAFGDTNSTISYLAQMKLIEAGVTSANLPCYDYLDSTLDFADEVFARGFSNAVQRIGYLNSHAQVIEGVLSGRYEVGVAARRAFSIHESRGLVAVPDSEFDCSRNLFVASPQFPAEHVAAFTDAMTSLEGSWLEGLPDKARGYVRLAPDTFAAEESYLVQVERNFPPKGPPPRIPVSELSR